MMTWERGGASHLAPADELRRFVTAQEVKPAAGIREGLQIDRQVAVLLARTKDRNAEALP